MKKLLILFAAFLLLAGFSACKARVGGAIEPEERQKGARENVVVKENPRIPPENLIQKEEPVVDKQEKDERPGELVEALLDAATTGDRAAIEQYADYGGLFGPVNPGDELDYGRILKNMSYELISSDVFDDEASVWVKIKNIDMITALPLFHNEAMKLEYDNALSDEPMGGAELESAYRELFAGVVEENKNGAVERLCEITVKKTGGEWKITPQTDLGNAMLGGYVSAKNLMGSSPAPVAVKQQEETGHGGGDEDEESTGIEENELGGGDQDFDQSHGFDEDIL